MVDTLRNRICFQRIYRSYAKMASEFRPRKRAKCIFDNCFYLVLALFFDKRAYHNIYTTKDRDTKKRGNYKSLFLSCTYLYDACLRCGICNKSQAKSLSFRRFTQCRFLPDSKRWRSYPRYRMRGNIFQGTLDRKTMGRACIGNRFGDTLVRSVLIEKRHVTFLILSHFPFFKTDIPSKKSRTLSAFFTRLSRKKSKFRKTTFLGTSNSFSVSNT